MTLFLEGICLLLSGCLCIICTRSDLSKGIIPNRIIFIFAACAIILDILYYSLFARDLAFDFIFNLIVVSFISIYLFYTHSFAGGDCKMAIVLALLYPARYYVIYGNNDITLIFALGFALLAGYIYLLINSIMQIVTKRAKLSAAYIKGFLLDFFKSYISAMAYIVLLNCIFLALQNIGIYINIWISHALCIFIAWGVGRYPKLKKLYFLIPTIFLTASISVITHTMPISLNPGNYTLVLILLLCQMTIKTTIYETVRVDQLSKGMILTTFSSVLMQSSITKGLPGVSTEDLKSRLTDEQVESIQIWAISHLYIFICAIMFFLY